MPKSSQLRRYIIDNEKCCGFKSNQNSRKVKPSKGITPAEIPSMSGAVCGSLRSPGQRTFFALSIVDDSYKTNYTPEEHEATVQAQCNNLGIFKSFFSKDYYQGRQNHDDWDIAAGLPEAILETGVHNFKFMVEAEGLQSEIENVDAVMRVDSTSDLNLKLAEKICEEFALNLETGFKLKKKTQRDYKDEVVDNLKECFGTYKSKVPFKLVLKIAKTHWVQTRWWSKSKDVRASIPQKYQEQFRKMFTSAEMDLMDKLDWKDCWRIQFYRWGKRVDTRDGKPMSWNKAIGLNPRIASVTTLSIIEKTPELEKFIKSIDSVLLVEDDGRLLTTFKSLETLLKGINTKLKIYNVALFDARPEVAAKTWRLLNWYRTYKGAPITNRPLSGMQLLAAGMPTELTRAQRKLRYYSAKLETVGRRTYTNLEYKLKTPFSDFIAQRRAQLGRHFVFEQIGEKSYNVWEGNKYQRSITLKQFIKRGKVSKTAGFERAAEPSL